MQRQIFRTAALERLSSPEQTDQLLQVTSAKSWMVLLALCGLVLATLLWGVLGQVPLQVNGHGVLIRGDSVKAVVAATTGRVELVNANVGDILEAGQSIAAITPLDGGGPRQGEHPLQQIVTSPLRGRVLEVAVNPGAIVNQAATILTMEPVADPVEMVLYLPASKGVKVRPGMLTQVEPNTVSRQQFGVILGRVRSVAEFPSTYAGMMRVLQNDRLVQSLLADGATVEVRLELDTDPTSPSGYRWSSSSGPPFPISSGTLATAVITLRQQRPISFVIPVLDD